MNHPEKGTGKEDLPVNKYFRALVDLRGSELRLQVGQPAIFCLKGKLTPLDMPVIEEVMFWELCRPLMDDHHQGLLKDTGNVEFDHVVDYKGRSWRFRVRVLTEAGKAELVTQRVE